MFCPRCKDEFRPGFTRCEGCGVDLVENPHDVPAANAAPGVGPVAGTRAAQVPVAMVEYCGFLELEEARSARDQLRLQRIRSEIVIRDTADPQAGGPAGEEYWLRVEHKRFREAAAALGYDPVDAGEAEAEEETFSCGDCGLEVSDQETFCPGCGARFEDD